MNTKQTSTGRTKPNDRLPIPPEPTLSSRVQRVRAFVDCLRDSFELAGRYYSRHLTDRATVCDYVNEELLEIAEQLERVETRVRRQQIRKWVDSRRKGDKARREKEKQP